MTEIRLFTGVNDSGELNELFVAAQTEGYLRVDGPGDIEAALENISAPQVILWGGLAGQCVAKTAKIATELGVECVLIPLANIRATPYDVGDGHDNTIVLWERNAALQCGLNENGLHGDSRVTIVWPNQ